MTLLRIPPRRAAALASLSTMDDGLVDSVAAILTDAPPSVDGDALADLVASRIEHDKVAAAEAIELLLSLTALRLRLDVDPPQLTETIIQAIEEADAGEFSLTEKHKQALAGRLNTLLGIESLIYAVKAADIIPAHEYTFAHARIITDVRPVFGSDVTSRPKAAAIIHTLQLTCHYGEQIKDFYLALDADDLALLKGVLHRAELKAQTLRAVLSDGGIASIGE